MVIDLHTSQMSLWAFCEGLASEEVGRTQLDAKLSIRCRTCTTSLTESIFMFKSVVVTSCKRRFLGACNICVYFRGFDGGSPPRNGAYNGKPYWVLKHLYMFVIDVGVAVLRKYGIGGTM